MDVRYNREKNPEFVIFDGILALGSPIMLMGPHINTTASPKTLAAWKEKVYRLASFIFSGNKNNPKRVYLDLLEFSYDLQYQINNKCTCNVDSVK